MTDDIAQLSTKVLEACISRNWMLATVESCTGGLVAAALTDIPGSSAVVERGFVTYSNAAKTTLVGVPPALIEAEGAVSADVAEAMARGALAHAPVDLAVAITGIAGPGGSAFKPEGLVFLHAATRAGRSIARRCDFGPKGRSAVRTLAVIEALRLLLALAEGHSD